MIFSSKNLLEKIVFFWKIENVRFFSGLFFSKSFSIRKNIFFRWDFFLNLISWSRIIILKRFQNVPSSIKRRKTTSKKTLRKKAHASTIKNNNCYISPQNPIPPQTPPPQSLCPLPTVGGGTVHIILWTLRLINLSVSWMSVLWLASSPLSELEEEDSVPSFEDHIVGMFRVQLCPNSRILQ